MSNDIDDLFAPKSAGPASATLSGIGDTVQGLIYKMERLEEKDEDGNVKMSQYGRPKPLFLVYLITSLRDPQNPEDDGSRRVWLKGNGLWTLKEFLKENSLGSPKVGGKLKVTVEALKKDPAFPMRKPMKIHSVLYAPPTSETETQAYAWAKKKEDERNSGGDDDFFGTPAQAKPTTLNSMRNSGGFDSDEPPF
jgi:hypothetical protein